MGRIAAIVNRTHNARYGDRTGFFGFFDSPDDPALAAALMEAAAGELRRRGCDVMRGPYNPSINEECGLLVEGFDRPPAIGLVWNPPYYRQLIEGAGFRPVFTSFGFELPLHRLEIPERFERIVRRLSQRSSALLRPIRMDRLEKELEIVHEVYNATLERNWGFVPISMEDLLGAAEDLRAFADPEMILIAEVNGENAGVALTLPDINQLLARLKQTPHWLRLPHLWWLIKTRSMTSARFLVYGISPRFRDRSGLHPWLLYEQFVRAKARFHDAALGWIEDSNTEILESSRMLGGIPRQEWRIYEKPL